MNPQQTSAMNLLQSLQHLETLAFSNIRKLNLSLKKTEIRRTAGINRWFCKDISNINIPGFLQIYNLFGL